jgi:hypothetical protein
MNCYKVNLSPEYISAGSHISLQDDFEKLFIPFAAPNVIRRHDRGRY